MKISLGILSILAIGVLVLAGCTTPKSIDNLPTSGMSTFDGVTMFKSMNCGCCGVYSKYVKKEGLNINVQNVEDITAVKERFNVPMDMRSCHTSQVGDYFVEGHVPVEAIEKLMAESPDIAGIALPGMPSGSPGMPGSKDEPWTIYAINHDGSTSEFMVI